MVNKQIPKEIIILILSYSTHSEANERLYRNKTIRYIQIKNIELNWNLFSCQVRCKHYNPNYAHIIDTITFKNKSNNSWGREIDIYDPNQYLMNILIHPLITVNYSRIFNSLNKEKFLSHPYRRSYKYVKIHNPYYYCPYSVLIPCPKCGKRYKFGYNPDYIIYDGAIHIPLEYSGLILTIL